MDLIEDLSRVPNLDEQPLTQEENDLVDHWIATEASCRAQVQRRGRASLGLIARQAIADGRIAEVIARSQGTAWNHAASLGDRVKMGLEG